MIPILDNLQTSILLLNGIGNPIRSWAIRFWGLFKNILFSKVFQYSIWESLFDLRWKLTIRTPLVVRYKSPADYTTPLVYGCVLLLQDLTHQLAATLGELQVLSSRNTWPPWLQRTLSSIKEVTVTKHQVQRRDSAPSESIPREEPAF